MASVKVILKEESFLLVVDRVIFTKHFFNCFKTKLNNGFDINTIKLVNDDKYILLKLIFVYLPIPFEYL